MSMKLTYVPSPDEVRAQVGPMLDLSGAVLLHATEAARTDFVVHWQYRPQPADFAAVTRLHAKHALVQRGQPVTDEHPDDDGGATAAAGGVAFERHPVANNGLCLSGYAYHLRILKAAPDGSVPLPTSQRRADYYSQMEQLAFDLDGEGLAPEAQADEPRNLVLLWQVDASSVLTTLTLALPKAGAVRRPERPDGEAFVDVHWSVSLPLPAARSRPAQPAAPTAAAPRAHRSADADVPPPLGIALDADRTKGRLKDAG